MATLTIPHSFTAGTPALASEVNANFQAIVNWTQSNIGTDNLGILTARSIPLPSSPIYAILSLSQTASQPVININNQGTDNAFAINQSGVFATGKGAIVINDPTTQTTGAAHLVMSLSGSSTIPAIKVNHGSDVTMNLTKNQFDLFNSAVQATASAVTFFTTAFQASASAITFFNNAIEFSNARIKLPVRTTSERNAVTQEGSVVYDTSKKEVAFRTDTTWIPASTPTGCVQMYAGSAAPQGWLYCNGQAVSRTTYPDLFAVLGTTYGNGDGSTTFNLPNFVGIFPRGASMDGISTQVISTVTYTGQALNTKQDDRFQEHTHHVHQRDNSNTHTQYPGFDGGGNPALVWRSGVSADGTAAIAGGIRTGRATTETRPANISIAFIIKA